MGEAALVTRDGQEPVIRVRGFGKRYRRRSALEGVDLTVRRGEIHGLIGPDGAGKSTLMKAVAGVLTFQAGEIEVYGVKIDSEAAAERVKDRIGFMPQGLGSNLYPELSVEENIDFFARIRLVPEGILAQRKDRLLAMTRLEKFRDRAMKHLSGGMKQKLGLVCTLIHEPELIILDEPTMGVDPLSRRDFWTILGELLRLRGITALVSTAYMDEASRFDRVTLLHRGRVLAEGEPEVLQTLVAGSEVRVRAEPQLQALDLLRARFDQVEPLGEWLHVFAERPQSEAAGEVRRTLAGVNVRQLETGEPDLEDVFIALLRRKHDAYRNALTPVTPSSGAPVEHRVGDAAIEAMALTRDFGAFRAVDNVSFSVSQGEIFGLLGANGAGKTTVIKMLTGILRPTSGTGRVAGADMRYARAALKHRIGYMSQAFSLYVDLTVIENIRLYAGIYGLGAADARERAAWIINMAALGGHETERAGRLPVGLRQRLALGCALVHRPQVLFLDEPTSGVDPVGRRRLWDILFRLSREEGVAILVTTHYMSEAEHCDQLALMYAGRIVADAAPAEMKRQVEAEAGRVLEIATRQPARAVDPLRRRGFEGVALFGKHVHVFSRNPKEDLTEIPKMLSAEGIAVDAVAPRTLSMEDVFVYRVTALERSEREISDIQGEGP